MKLVPDKIFKNITKITPSVLEKENIKALLLDIDNTLAPRTAEMPEREIAEWVEQMKSSNIKLYIVSNNHKKRVERISKSLGIPFRCHGLKPFPQAFFYAAKSLSVPLSEVAAVGDQIFTDICGARFAGIKAWLVLPLDTKEGYLVKFRRIFEKRFIKSYFDENGGNE